MKKAIYPIFLIVVLLCSCAKVTQEGLPCQTVLPPTPIVADLVITPGSTGYAVASNYQFSSTTIVFKGPNNFISTSTNGQLYLDFTNNTNYGQYTATAIVNGCRSNQCTFHVAANFTGAPTCTISPSGYNSLVGSNGRSFQFTSGTFSGLGSVYCSYGGSDINASTTSGNYYLDINILGQPTAGTYLLLVNTCNLSSGQAFITLTPSGTGSPVYWSTGGKVYFNTISGQTYATFCGATFAPVSGGSTFTMTGNVQYF